MVGNQTILKKSGKSRPFSFDFSFWSHDGYEEQENGYFKAVTEKYADQQHVYDVIGEDVLDNAFKGYHCTLFAYGQTGSGKSYSMIGYKVNKGIVPMACDRIFEKIKSNKKENMEFEVCLSMVEIYNERVQDLLIPIDKRPLGGLQIRFHKKKGFFVEGLKKFPVSEYKQIENYMHIGTQNRTVAGTAMNATSSRAHTIIIIDFKQIEIFAKKKMTKNSIINLVDLAGSERQKKTLSGKDRLKEGCSINKSLTTLGKVICVLADKAMGKAKKSVVPFRESALTKILANALGGNSKTYMICAVSPASDNYDETLGTLRYADQAKKIKCKAVINENQSDKMIRELKEENLKLKNMIDSMVQNGEIPPELAAIIGEMQGGKKVSAPIERKDSIKEKIGAKEEDERTAELMKKLKQAEEALKANQLVTKEYETTFNERMEDTKKTVGLMNYKQIDLALPHIYNINEDPMLTNQIFHDFKEQHEINVGRKEGNPKPIIIISAIGIEKNHARFYKDGNAIFLEPMCEKACNYIRLNGEKVSEPSRLFHLDRIVFGTGTAFLFKYPEEEEFSRTTEDEKNIDLEFCQREISKVEQLDMYLKTIEDEEIQKKLVKTEEQVKEYQDKLKDIQIKVDNAKMERERVQREKNFKEMELEFDLKKMQKDYDMQKMKQEMLEQEQKKLNKTKERKVLEEKLTKYIPLITEVNLIAKEIKRGIHLEPHLAYFFSENQDLKDNDQLKRLKVKVKVNNYEVNYSYIWDLGKFHNRYYIIKELLDQYFETNKLPVLTQQEDPFWDPPEPQLIGQGFLKLMSLAYLLDNPTNLVLVGENGKVGSINVNLIPSNSDGDVIDSEVLLEDELIDDYKELIGRRLDFVIQIQNGELNSAKSNNVFCKYTLKLEDETSVEFTTDTLEGEQPHPEWNYYRHHFFPKISEQDIGYILNTNLCIEVYGNKKNNKSSSGSSSEEISLENEEDFEQKPQEHIPQIPQQEPMSQIPQQEPISQVPQQQKVDLINDQAKRQRMEKERVNKQRMEQMNREARTKNRSQRHSKHSHHHRKKLDKKKDKDCSLI